MNRIYVVIFALFAALPLRAIESGQKDLGLKLEEYSKNFFSKKLANFDFQTFVISTEMEIGKAWGIVDQAPKGSFFSVGSEFAFRALSMMPSSEMAFLVDLDPKLIRFNKINIELLKAETRQEYRRLRWESDYSEWTKISAKLIADDFSFWQVNVRDLYSATYYLPEMLNRYETDTNYETFHKFLKQCLPAGKSKKRSEKQLKRSVAQCLTSKKTHFKGVSASEIEWFENKFLKESWGCFKGWKKDFSFAVNMASVIDYKTGNYLFSDELYSRLHRLASENKIISFQVDLKDRSFVRGIVEIMKKAGISLSLIDLDNLYWKEYIGQDSYHDLIQDLAPLAHQSALVLAMTNYKNYSCGQYQAYFGFKYSFLKDWNFSFKIQDYIGALKPETLGHIKGKIFSREEPPPYFDTWQLARPKDASSY